MARGNTWVMGGCTSQCTWPGQGEHRGQGAKAPAVPVRERKGHGVEEGGLPSLLTAGTGVLINENLQRPH